MFYDYFFHQLVPVVDPDTLEDQLPVVHDAPTEFDHPSYQYQSNSMKEEVYTHRGAFIESLSKLATFKMENQLPARYSTSTLQMCEHCCLNSAKQLCWTTVRRKELYTVTQEPRTRLVVNL